MAVWIGGAVAEIERVRGALAGNDAEPGHAESGATAQQPGDTHPWGELAKLAGYDSVEVDVLAGTSAGGLNATLLSASIVYGMPFGAMRRMWVRLADLEAMARPVPKFWHRRPQSLLEGDDYFRPELARTIAEHAPARRRAQGPGSRVDLLLTATLLEPVVERHFDGRSEPITRQRRRAAFRFRHRGEPGHPLSDFGAGADFPGTAAQLAQAARATSSFPAAFEPAGIFSAEGEPGGDVPNMYGLFSETRTPPERRPFPVVDGGVLDNIPVTAAIRSIADAAADRPTERWLLYLNPEPDQAVPERGKPRGRRFALPVTTTALRAKMGQESLLADIAALDEHNHAVRRTDLRRSALFAEIAATPPDRWHRVLADRVETVRGRHAVVRAELDAAAVHRLLTESETAADGCLPEPVTGDPLADWSATARTELRASLAERLGRRAHADPSRVFDGVGGLLSGVHECLGWAQDIECSVPQEQAREIGRCKAVLYRLRVFGEVLATHADRYWVTGARTEPITRLRELGDWVERVAQRHHRLQHRLPSPVRPLLGAVLDAAETDGGLLGARFQHCLEEFATELSSIVESSGADAVPGDGDPGHVDAVAEASTVLYRIAARMAAAAPGRDEDREPRRAAYSLLERAEPDQRSAVLDRLVVLTAPLDVGRAPGSHIKFLRVASDVPSPLPFGSLRRDGVGRIRIPDKVRGSALGNFAAFLSAKWRANDWMWGRLDSVAGLVPLLTDPVRLVRHNAALGAEGLGDAFQAVVCRPTRAELGELDEVRARRWRDFLAERWAVCAGDVRAELDALFASPESEHPLTETRRVITERLQWAVVAEEVPFVAVVESGADPDAADTPSAAEPERLSARVQRYDVGRQRLTDLGEQRMASVATRFALIAYRAVLPGRSGALKLLARIGMTVLKPLLMVLAFAFAAPTRAALVTFLAASAAAFTGPGAGWWSAPSASGPLADDAGRATWTAVWGTGPSPDTAGTATDLSATEMSRAFEPVQRIRADGPAPHWLTLFDFSGVPLGPGGYIAFALAVVAAVWLGWQAGGLLSSGGLVRRLAVAAAVAVALIAGGYWLLTTGWRLGPLGLALCAAGLTWPATFAYRPGGRVAATVLTASVFGLVMWGSAVLAWSVAAWIAAAIAVSAYAHTALLGTVDVLPPRPRPRDDARSPAALRETGRAGDDLRAAGAE